MSAEQQTKIFRDRLEFNKLYISKLQEKLKTITNKVQWYREQLFIAKLEEENTEIENVLNKGVVEWKLSV